MSYIEYGLSRNNSVPRCKSCSAIDVCVDPRTGDHVCRTCGEVQQSRLLVESSEIRNLDEDTVPGSKSRHAGKPDSKVWKDPRMFSIATASGARINNDVTELLNKCSEKADDSKGKMMLNAMRMANELFFSLHLQEQEGVEDKAESLLSRCYEAGCQSWFTRKKIPMVAIASLVYLSCKMEKIGRTVDEICAATGGVVHRHDVWKTQLELSRSLGLALVNVTPEEVVGRIGSASKQPSEVIEKARQACRGVSSRDILPAQPPQLVASAVLVLAALISNSQISLRDVSRASISCSTQQICRAYGSLYPYADLVLQCVDLGGFDLAQLPAELTLGPDPAKRKRKREKERERETVKECSHGAGATTERDDGAQAQALVVPSGMPRSAAVHSHDALQASVMKIANSAKIDLLKPRTRANSALGEDQEVVAPLFPQKTKKKRKKKGSSSTLTGEGNDVQMTRYGALGPFSAQAASNEGGVAKKSSEVQPPLSPAGSLASMISHSSHTRGESTATAAAASYLRSRTNGSVATTTTTATTSNSSSNSSSQGPVCRGPSQRSKQAALDALEKHDSPLFRDVPRPKRSSPPSAPK